MKKNTLLLTLVAIFLFAACGNQAVKEDENGDKDSVEVVLTPTHTDLQNAIQRADLNAERFNAFAQKAKEEKLPEMLPFFQAMAAAEKVYISELSEAFKVMGGQMSWGKPEVEVKSTRENFALMMKEKEQERNELYPAFIENAGKNGADEASVALEMVLEAEKMIIPLYEAADKALQSGNFSKLPLSYSVCPKCGLTYDSKLLPESCDLCGTSKEKFTAYK